MLNRMLKAVFGTENDRNLKEFKALVKQINDIEPTYKAMSDKELKQQTEIFKKQLSEGKTLDDILPQAFATVREAAFRVLKMRPFDVQLLGGIILHKGMITEMKTGEGKTLVATMPVYLNALEGKGVHVVTVNDYLAKRDGQWMGQVYEFLGLTVGFIINEMEDEERKQAYNCDVIYATNNEIGFDYLRDNMKFTSDSMVQREFNYAIVDEVDSILIDEARTPLIISGATEKSSDLYVALDKIAPMIRPEHYKLDEKHKNVILNEEGMQFVEDLCFEKGLTKEKNLYDIQNANIIHHLDKALIAHKMFKKDVDYLVKGDDVYIIDEFTGRAMEGRRYSDGLHQAIEAKEGVPIQQENQTLASITYQNLFRLYPKLAGMTGTAMTEQAEFVEIYKLKVIDVPTNVPVARIDHEDEIYKTAKEKYDAVFELIKECYDRKQPVLVGTTSIEKSEYLADKLKKEAGVTASVLNAKQHEREAHIVAKAGMPGAITIATNMAGRGTDIQLGGNVKMMLEEAEEKKGSALTDAEKKKILAEIENSKEVARQAGGLYVIATERHESRRIDNQLRGRSGRQGDFGASKFFLSLEDDLMRIFGGEKIQSMLGKFGFKDGEAITHRWISKALERAQKKVEAHHFDVRKQILKYDDVMNEQRKVVYAKRKEFMSAKDLSPQVKTMSEDVLERVLDRFIPENSDRSRWDLENLQARFFEIYGLNVDFEKQVDTVGEKEIYKSLLDIYNKHMQEKDALNGRELMQYAEKIILLQNLDDAWKEHLLNLDHLRNGIGLRGYGQKNPIDEYKKEAFLMFAKSMDLFELKSIEMLSKAQFKKEDVSRMDDEQQERAKEMNNIHPDNNDEKQTINNKKNDKIGRNAPCPCGSEKKYKHCCGKM